MWVILGSVIFLAFWGFLMFKGKWFLKRPQWQRILSMGIMATMMGTMAWYMNNEAAKVEPRWAEGDKAVAWEQKELPILVDYDPAIRKDVMRDAVNILNRGTCKLFRLVKPGEDWDVMVVLGSYGELNPESGKPMAGSTWRVPGLLKQKFLIKLHDPGNITKQMLGIAHELTHVIGLAHDFDARFITTQGAQDRDDLSKFLPHLSRTDTKLLKAEYCD